EWSRYDARRTPWTIRRYSEALVWVIRYIGDRPIATLHLEHLLSLRRQMGERGCREARVAAILNTVRSFLKFCRDIVGIPALDPQEVRVPRVPRRDVVYLTKDEVEAFVNAVVGPAEDWSRIPISRLRFRALVEVLLGTGARISEALSLNRSQIDVNR